MVTKKPQRPILKQKEFHEQRAGLARDSEEWNHKYRNAVDAHDQELIAELSKTLGVDMEELFQQTARAMAKRTKALRREQNALVKRASTLAGREGKAHRAALGWALRDGGLAPLVEKYLHNPRLTMKVCFDWDPPSTSPPGGIGPQEGPSTEVDDRISIIDGGQSPDGEELPDFVEMLHPFVRADVGDDYYGHASAWVHHTLRYRHSAPERQMLINRVGIILDVHGVGSAWSSDFSSPFMTRAMSAGGDAALDMSITVAQSATDVVGRPIDTVVEVARDVELARFRARGGIHWFMGRLGGAAWGGVSMNSERREFDGHLFPVYGTSSTDEPLGGDITVTVEFHTWADADYYHADAEIGFREPGHGIKIRSLFLEGD